MRRRGFLIAIAVLAVARASSAQQSKVWRIGFLYFGSKQSAQETGRYAAFLRGMRELGYAEGKNLAIEAHNADGSAQRLPELAAALVRAKVDVIVASGTPANQAARKATATIPIVMTLSVDPVADGVAASLARPGGNVTGLTTLVAELNQKYSDARTSAEIEGGVARMARERCQALVIAGDALFVQQRHQIAELVSYGPDLRDNFRRAAIYTDRILRGAKPGELAIEQPSKFEMVINLRTARALGLTIPKEMQFRADRLIE